MGNAKLMKDRGISLGKLEDKAEELSEQGKTPMFVAVEPKPGRHYRRGRHPEGKF